MYNAQGHREALTRKRVPKDASWDVATAANGDHKVWIEIIEDTSSVCLAELVHLCLLSVVRESRDTNCMREC